MEYPLVFEWKHERGIILLHLLFNLFQIQINPSSMCENGIFHGVTLVVDGTDCPIDTPSTSKEERLRFCSGRNKENAHSRYNWKYTLAVSPFDGKICQILGPVVRRISDMEALQQCNNSLSAVLMLNGVCCLFD